MMAWSIHPENMLMTLDQCHCGENCGSVISTSNLDIHTRQYIPPAVSLEPKIHDDFSNIATCSSTLTSVHKTAVTYLNGQSMEMFIKPQEIGAIKQALLSTCVQCIT